MADEPEASSNAPKPDPDHVPLDAEAKRLKLEQTKAESRKAIAQADQAIAEAQKSALLAKLPTTDVKPLEGKIDVGDKSGLPADVLAHSLVNDAAGRIARAIDATLGANARLLVVEDRNLAQIDWPYQAVRRQLTEQKRSVRTSLRLLERELRAPAPGAPRPPPVDADARVHLETLTFGSAATLLQALPSLGALGTVATAAPAAVGAIAAVAAMFHSDYSITPRDVTITTTPLVGAVAAAVLGQKREVTVAGFHLVRESVIGTDFWDAWNGRVKLEQLKLQVATRDVAPIEQEIADLQKQLDAAVAEHEQLVAATAAPNPGTPPTPNTPAHAALMNLRDEMRQLDDALATRRHQIAAKKAAVAVADTVIQRFDAFATATTTAAGDAKYPPLVAAAIQERLRLDEPQAPRTRDNRFTHVLFVAVEAAGGETITRRNIFLGSRLRYVGGAQFSYLLLDTHKNVTVAAGSDSLLADLKYNLFWRAGPKKRTMKCLSDDATGAPSTASKNSTGGVVVGVATDDASTEGRAGDG
jgi:hypothetical protein